MTADFQKCVQFVLDREGGYSLDPHDPGGETNFGISKRAYPNLDIKNLSRAGAVAIYEKDYWTPIGAASMPQALALVHFDTAVNQGPGRAKALLAKSGGDAEKYLLLRMQDYALNASTHPERRKFLLGWINRLSECFKAMGET